MQPRRGSKASKHHFNSMASRRQDRFSRPAHHRWQGACGRCPWWGHTSDRLFLAESVSASSLSVHARRSFDRLDWRDGQVTAKLRPKEDSDCGPLLSSMSVSDGVLSRGLCGRG